MFQLVHDLIHVASARTPTAEALRADSRSLTYESLNKDILRFAQAVVELRIDRGDRIAIFLDKRFETVIAIFGTVAAGAVFVPVNPHYKSSQVVHILQDCGVRVLVTSAERLRAIAGVLSTCGNLRVVLLVDRNAESEDISISSFSWGQLMAVAPLPDGAHRAIDTDMAAILYTSGSTGKPKGVVLSHRNIVTGAKSVVQYLENRPEDRILAALPFSFDYGLSQLTTAFTVGAVAVLSNPLLPRDLISACERERITGLAAVPPLWIQLAALEWPTTVTDHLRYITSSGGVMPKAITRALRKKLPNTQIFLMYGLTEAFRSTFLPPEEVDRRPDSIGKAAPNADVVVVRPDGTPCLPGEPGELVHRGSLVTMGYWNDPVGTSERFRPDPLQTAELCVTQVAVWSGDTVRMDDEGFFYFIGRQDDMIKTSGYRVSPSEVEEVIYAAGLAGEAAALGVIHPVLGQAIIIARTCRRDGDITDEELLNACKRHLPAFMVPLQIITFNALPRNANGKIDRNRLVLELGNLFQTTHD